MSNHRQRTFRAIAYIMGTGCANCGYSKSVKSLHCHHLNPSEKEFNISQCFVLKKKWHEIENELKKCIQLCSNCHSEYHAGLITIPQESSFSDDRLNEVRTKCKTCNEQIEEIGHIFCSKTCGGIYHKDKIQLPPKNSRKIAIEFWNKTDVINLLEKYNGNVSLLSKHIGVSSKSIKRQFIKITGYPTWKAYQAALVIS